MVSLAGELDAASTHLLRQCLADLAQEGPSDVVLDVSDLSFVDSSGLGALAAGLRWLRASGGSLALRSPSRGLTRKLQLTGLDTVMTIDRARHTPRGRHKLAGSPAQAAES